MTTSNTKDQVKVKDSERQPKVIKALNKEHIQLSLVTLSTNVNNTKLNFSIRGRHRFKSPTHVINPCNAFDAQESAIFLLAEFKSLARSKGFSYIRINHEDQIFKDNFIHNARKVLNDLAIHIMQFVKVIESLTEKRELWRLVI